MRRKLLHSLIVLLLLPAAAPFLRAQEEEKKDKVLLISAKSAQLIEKDGESYRKVVGPARFLHNDTYLLCDTALWNVNTNIIDAVGNVRIIQDQTQLSSSTLQYVVDDNMAKFRGDLVQLEDKDHNVLRTRYLDYNTKDSVAVFQDGAAMRDKDGQIMESLYGTYDSKAHLFVFNDQVNMYLDTTFVRTSRMEYRSDLSTAWFGFGTDMWQDDKMLSANDGWYKREEELFMFRRRVHLLTEDQETWSDTLYYHRALNNVEMLGNVELMDTTRNVYALAGRFEYTDSLDQVRMTREPAIMSVSEEEGQRDTLYLGGDLLLYRAIRKCDIPEGWSAAAQKRLTDIAGDPVMEYRRKAAEAAAKAAEEAKKNDPNRPPDVAQRGKGGPTKDATAAKGGQPESSAARMGGPSESSAARMGGPKPSSVPKDTVPGARRDSVHRDTLGVPRDSLGIQRDTLGTQRDSLGVQRDTTAESIVPQKITKEEEAEPEVAADTTVVEPPKDTTKLNFLWASSRVRLFRKDLQMSSDSLTYNDLDSLVRLYKDPIFFNEGNRQYASDSSYLVVRGRKLEKAHLLSNAFITIQEDPVCFDQIRGTEMVAYFDSTSALTRFDALGGASSLFFLVENEALATVNKVDAKMIYATFSDGDIDHIYYYENPKNDGYPSVQLPEEERTLKGFRWEPERRPSSPKDVTSLEPRPSERYTYLARPHAEFKQTEVYFPGYIGKVYRDIAIRDSLQVVRERERQRVKDSLARAEADSLSLAALADSLAAKADSLALETAVKDSLSVTSPTPKDTVAVSAPADTLSAETQILTPQEQKALEKQKKEAERARQKALKEEKKKAKQAAREAKWAEEDRKYEEKQAAKAQKKLDKERARKLKTLRKLEKKAQKERAKFEKYLQREQEKAARALEKQNLKKK